jgi:hypothetical protein
MPRILSKAISGNKLERVIGVEKLIGRHDETWNLQGMDGAANDVDDLRPGKPAPPCESDSTTGYRVRDFDRDQPIIPVFGCQGAAGHHGNPKPGDDHLSDGFQGVTLPTFCIRATQLGAGLKYLLTETMSGMWKEDLLGC